MTDIMVLDIWFEKIRRGWKIDNAPNRTIKKELRKILKKRGEISKNDT